MSNPLIRASDHYVLLEPDSKEKIVSKQEAILWLKNWHSKTETQTIYQNIEDPDQEFFEELLLITIPLSDGYLLELPLHISIPFIIICSYLSYFVTKNILIKTLNKIIIKTSTNIDDILVEKLITIVAGKTCQGVVNELGEVVQKMFSY